MTAVLIKKKKKKEAIWMQTLTEGKLTIHREQAAICKPKRGK
jgi:hypothetical protein